MAHRVIQWGTGNAGKPALRAIIRHPDLELVGVHAHGDQKVGKDAAELCGLAEPTGVIATNDVEALLALDADCVSYMAIGETRPNETVADLMTILRSGKNIVSTAIVSLIYPPFAHPKLREVLETACREGKSSLYTSGIDPGASSDVIPLALMGLCERVDSVRVTELMNYSTYADPGFTGEYFGFGKPLDYTPPLLLPGVLKWGWGGMLMMLADAMGVELDEIREKHDRVATEEPLETAMGRIEAGTCAALRFEIEGMVDGRAAFVAEHVNRLADDIAPEWPKPSPGKGSGYRIRIEGSPSFTCELELKGDDGDHNTAGITATAMRVINAIPAVCAAKPGMVSTLDLPLFTARGLLARS